MQYYLKSTEEALKEVDSSTEGLMSSEAEKRLSADGKNKLKEPEKDSLFKKLMQQFADPMIIILIVCLLYTSPSPRDS